MKHYFSPDGNFGNAEGLVIVPTAKWSRDDWEDIEDSQDGERHQVATEKAELYKKVLNEEMEMNQLIYSLKELQVCYDTDHLIMLFQNLLEEGYTGLSLGLVIDLIKDRLERIA